MSDRDKKQTERIRELERQVNSINIDIIDLTKKIINMNEIIIDIQDKVEELSKEQTGEDIINSLSDLLVFIRKYHPELEHAGTTTGEETKALAKELRNSMIEKCSNLELHPRWVNDGDFEYRHLDAIYDIVKLKIIDFVRGSTEPGLFIEKLQWIVVSE